MRKLNSARVIRAWQLGTNPCKLGMIGSRKDGLKVMDWEVSASGSPAR